MPRSKSKARRPRASSRWLAAALWSALAVGVFGTIWWVAGWSESPPGSRAGGEGSSPSGDAPYTSEATDGTPRAGTAVRSTEAAVRDVGNSDATVVRGPARIALVIDDLGRSVATVDRLRRIGVPITYAVLPYESRTAEVVQRLASAREEMILHLPMQAKGTQNPGPGALSVDMTPAQVREVTARALDQTPGAVGVNNHMGSAFTANADLVAAVMEEVSARGLLFLDSRTTPETVGASQARAAGVPWVERSVFLDNERSEGAIRERFVEGLGVAAERGQAVLIGHPYAETLTVLEREVPLAVERGYEFVVISRLAASPPLD